MPIVIASKARYTGTVTPPDLNVETTVIEIEGQSDDYLVEGYIDLSQVGPGDEVIVKEYISIDGVNYQLFSREAYIGYISEPAVRFHTKTLLYFMKYKVTITQTSGTIKSYPYAFIVEVMATA